MELMASSSQMCPSMRAQKCTNSKGTVVIHPIILLNPSVLVQSRLVAGNVTHFVDPMPLGQGRRRPIKGEVILNFREKRIRKMAAKDVDDGAFAGSSQPAKSIK